jgi:pimeloyl-ACP methyl ester carboxylesterase
MAETSARYQSYDGSELAYRVLGPDPVGDSGTPLIALAGGPGRDAAYLGDLGGLSADRPLIIPDLRGTGDSRVAGADPSAYAFPRLAEDVEALRRALGLERVAVLGHSAAATLAEAYAARHPERVSHLLLITPGTRLQARRTDDAERIFRARSAESWYEDAVAAVSALDNARDLAEVRRLLLRAAPATYGEWGPAQQAHAEAEGGQLNPVPRAAFWQGVDHGTRLTLRD